MNHISNSVTYVSDKMFEINVVTVARVCPQWLVGDEAEDEDVAEEGDEGGVDQEDDHKGPQLLLNTSLFVQDFFFSFFSNFPVSVLLARGTI